jgi:hypothetical protein
MMNNRVILVDMLLFGDNRVTKGLHPKGTLARQTLVNGKEKLVCEILSFN